jgi:hypothetical protein
MTDRRRALLLGFAAVLALLRFAVVPWNEAQGESRDRLQVLTQRLDRSVGVVRNRDAILAAREELGVAAEAARGRFPTAASPEAFRLDGQRRVGAVVSAAGLQLALFDWVLDGSVPDAGLGYGRIRFQVDGPLKDIARLHAELEGELPFLVVREMQLNFRGEAAALDDTPVSMTLVADLFFRPQAPT